MKPERILLPIDVTRCPLEVFELVNGFAKRPEVTVILLHVVNLHVATQENRAHEQLHQDAEWYLDRLAEKHIHPIASTLTHIRTGGPAEQILAEAKAESVDLIILPTYGPSFWQRLTGIWKQASSPMVSPLAEKVIREAMCGVFVVLAKTRLNCDRAWGRPVKDGKALSPLPARVISQAHQPTTVNPLQPLPTWPRAGCME